jgi:hypothetical protein
LEFLSSAYQAFKNAPVLGEKTFSPSSPKGGLSFLFLLSAPRVRLKSLLWLVCLSGSRQIYIEPTGALQCKSAVCGLNGLRPASTRGSPPFKSSTAFALLLLRPPSVGRFAYTKKIWHPIFFSPKPNFESFVPATLALQRAKTLCSPLVEAAFVRPRRVATPAPVQLRGQSQRPR